MAVPTGGEVAIYNSGSKRVEVRIAVGLDYPALTAEKTVTFDSGTAPDPRDFYFTQHGGDVLVNAGSADIRSKGRAPVEVMRTKDGAGWFPDSPDHPFEHEFNVTFPQADPIYTPVVTVGSVQQTQGADLYEPLIVQATGTATKDGFGIGDAAHPDVGEVGLFSTGAIRHTFANDQASHEYIVQWDPQLAVNANKLTLKLDGTPIVATDVAWCPRYSAFGWPWGAIRHRRTGEYIAALTGIQTLMQVHDVTTRQLGSEGYETRVRPDWTTANDDGTSIEDADEGELWEEDGETWAKVPVRQVSRVVVERGRSLLADTFTVSLKGRDQSGDSDDGNIFAGDRLEGRPILIDTRVINRSTGAATAWKRQIAGRIRNVRTVTNAAGAVVELQGRSEVADRLDTFLSVGFFGTGGTVDAEVLESLDVVPDMDEILERMVGVSDKVNGSLTGNTALDIRAPAIIPDSLSSGGQSLLPSFARLCQQLGLEYYTVYSTSGTARYGQLRAHAWTLGSGTAGFTFRGFGSASPANFVSCSIGANTAAPGQVSYRQNLPVVNNNTMVNLWKLPAASVFPTFPYPLHGRQLSDSIAFAKSLQATAVQTLEDKDGNIISGGPAPHRYRAENTRRRMVELDAFGMDWFEPTDEVGIDDSRCGALPGETFVLDGGTIAIANGRMTTRLYGFTSDWFTAIQRSA